MVLWFTKRSTHKTEQLEKAVKIDVEQHKREGANVIAKTKKITDNFNKVLMSNGVTISIHIAAGGKPH